MKNYTHYNMDDIISRNSNINIVYGERSNGKSYQFKHKIMFTDDIINGDRRFILVRRKKDELTTEKIERYFQDVDIERITKGEYDCIDVWRREVFLAKFNHQKFKKERGKKIGYVIPLEREQDYAGASFLDVDNIIYEEFMSRDRYLYDEPNKLMNLYCTVDRKRGTTKLWLCGNSISRVCPYLADWDIMDIMRTQEQGTIIDRDFDVSEDETVKMSIEYCRNTGATSYVIGSHAGMLSTGEWQSDPQPHLPKSLKNYDISFISVFTFKQFSFLVRYLTDKETGEHVWFICDKRGTIKDNTWEITDIIKQDHKCFRDPYTVKTTNKRIKAIFDDFRENKIFYSTDLTGTDFKQAIDFIIKK